MKIVGHTMGTPESTVHEALDLFAALGLDGIEIICADDYNCGLNRATSQDELIGIRQQATDAGLVVAGLVPYTKDMNSAEAAARQKAVADLKRVIDMAVALDCPALRVFGGHEVPASEQGIALNWLAESLRELGEFAATAGLQLNIENHMDTMATSAEMTMAIVRAVDLPNVGVLYDQANLSFMGQEDHSTAIAMQGARINHVHVKDFYWKGTDRIAALLGQGIVPWQEIVDSLTNIGYAGYYSLEYERRWFPEQLPAPASGMKQCLDFLRATAG